MVKFFLVLGLLALATGCTGSETTLIERPNPRSTTIPYPETEVTIEDRSVLPDLLDPDRYELHAVRIRPIEGFTVDEARDWAVQSGWVVREVANDEADTLDFQPRPAMYHHALLGLYVTDDVVTEAWTGGYRPPG